MASPARDARNYVQSIWPGATVHERGGHYIVHAHPTIPGKFRLDAGVGDAGWHISGTNTEVDTAILASTVQPYLYMMEQADFRVYIGNGTTEFDSGQLITFVHPGSGKSIAFQPQQLQYGNTINQIQAVASPQKLAHTSIVDDTIRWNAAYGTGYDFEWRIDPVKLQKRLFIDQFARLPAPTISTSGLFLRVPFIFQKDSTIGLFYYDPGAPGAGADGYVEWGVANNTSITTAHRVQFRSDATGEVLWAFDVPFVQDSAGNLAEVTLFLRATAQSVYIEVHVPYTWLQSAVYPVLIDPTVDATVQASTDDGSELNGAAYNTFATSGLIDGTTDYFAARWNVTISSGATIDVAYAEFYVWADARDDPNGGTLDAHDTQTPAAISTSSNDISNRTSTTANVTWSGTSLGTGYKQTPSIVSIIQELVDTYDYSSGDYIMLIFQGSSSSLFDVNMYDYGAGREPKIHIEYSTGGSTQNITGAGAISSAEAFGTPKLNLELLPASISSAESVSTPSVTITVTVASIDSAESFGVASVLPQSVSVLPSSIDSAESFEAPLVSPQSVSVLPSSIDGAESFGTASILPQSVSVLPSSIDGAEAFGTASIRQTWYPFQDTFTGVDQDAWDSVKWMTSVA